VLDVDVGDEFVRGVRIDGPDIHTFPTPTLGAAVDATLPLALSWRREDTAAVVTLDTDELDDIALTDTGSYELAAGALKSERDKALTNELRLRREIFVAPAGAVGESSWTVAIENRITVVANAAP
jgi:hypothetical protein